ncbi:hypothetical protein [Persephonella sp.]
MRNLRRAWEARKDRIRRGLSMEREAKNPVEVIDEYLERLKQAEPKYYQEVVELAHQYPPLKTGTSCVVAIPVVGFGGQAKRTIRATLGSFDAQDTDGRVEINCFVNKPNGVNYDETPNIIEGYKPKNPNITVVSGKTEIPRRPRSRPLMGKIRALQIDSILYRIRELFQREPEGPVPIILLVDDDVVWVNPNAVENYNRTFKAKPNLELIVGGLRFDSLEYPSVLFPPFYVADELMYTLPWFNKSLINQLNTKREPLSPEEIRATLSNIFSSSFTKGIQSNIAFRPEAYATVGGAFERTQDINELDLMVRLFALSGLTRGRCNIGFLGNEVLVLSNSRRALLEYLEGEGRAPIQQWRSERFKIRVEDEARLRQPNIQGVIPIAELDKEKLWGLVSSIEQQINSTLEDYVLPSADNSWCPMLNQVIIDALESIGVYPDDYYLNTYALKDGLYAQISFRQFPQRLIDRLQALQTAFLQKRNLKLSSTNIPPSLIEQGFVVRPETRSKGPMAPLRSEVIYGVTEPEVPDFAEVKLIPLPLKNE